MAGPESSSRPEPAPRMAPPALAPAGARSVRPEVEALDVAVYAAISVTPTPTLDRSAAALSRAADGSKLWIGVAGLLAVTGPRGRRAAVNGLASVAVTSAVVNLLLKPHWRRRRPDRAAHRVPLARQVVMPRSTSFPSGHAASAFAFATGVAREMPVAAIPLQAAASLVAYSRVHTGVHYPIDVIAGGAWGARWPRSRPRLSTAAGSTDVRDERDLSKNSWQWQKSSRPPGAPGGATAPSRSPAAARRCECSTWAFPGATSAGRTSARGGRDAHRPCEPLRSGVWPRATAAPGRLRHPRRWRPTWRRRRRP